MIRHGSQHIAALAAGALVWAPVVIAADRPSDKLPAMPVQQAEAFPYPVPMIPEPVIIMSPYQGYLLRAQQRLAEVDRWIEALRNDAAQRTGEARESMAQQARNVERQLEQAEEKLVALQQTDITRRDSVRQDLDESLAELTRVHDAARTALRERYGIPAWARP